MAIKIVQFKNGKYGIRKFSLLELRYKFLSKNINYWWASLEKSDLFQFYTYKQAKERLREYKQSQEKDYGNPVKERIG